MVRHKNIKELRMNFGTVVVIAGFSGIFSFVFLAAAIGSDYWYIIKVNQENLTNSEDLDSHSGLWRINEGTVGYEWSFHDMLMFRRLIQTS